MGNGCPVCGLFISSGLEEHVNICLDRQIAKNITPPAVKPNQVPPKRVSTLSEFRAKLTSKSLNVNRPVEPPTHGSCYEIYADEPLQTPRGYAIPYFKTLIYTRYSVDAFKWGSLEGCTGYFLTHFHSDHYQGLNSSWAGRAPIYCSETTAKLVILRLGVSPGALNILNMNGWISFPDMRVMLIDANHCPGSVMFLFHITSEDKYILHTGDCRAGPSLVNNPILQAALEEKKLHVNYLDTTYCGPKHTFPCQMQVIEECSELVKAVVEDRKQVRFSPIRRLVLVGSYVIGKERIALAIAKCLNSKIHVDDWKHEVLRTFDWPELIECLTKDPLAASVHIVSMAVLNKDGLNSYLEQFYPKHYTNILAIRPTGWTGLKTITNSHDFHGVAQKCTRKQALTIHSVPYSEHSSFTELADLLTAFPAEYVIPTVSNDTRDLFVGPNGASPIDILLYWQSLAKPK